MLVKKLDAAGIAYEEVTDVDEMTALGIKSAPVLSVDGELLDFSGANAWIRELTVKKE